MSVFGSCSIRPRGERPRVRPGHVSSDKAYSSRRNGYPVSLAIREGSRLQAPALSVSLGRCRGRGLNSCFSSDRYRNRPG
ncbi:hypothetical protein FE633_17230 [Streptomyces montanus]|uniref:Uncharacterized protein n=1 Tax=Streptomyces montanus TaxID=2580423 RepID=A0A5R9FLX3_9ACTN|nr:hypothetical protein FE633_17230 [Streptomyces montanus]